MGYVCMDDRNMHITDIYIYEFIYLNVYRQTYMSLCVYACMHI